MNNNSQGLLYCARYSVAPNFYGYCGPDKNASLVDHLKENKADKEVKNIFSDFDTLIAYLKLISYENKIENIFDKKVVEAYWIGNRLLENISNLDYFYLLKEKLNIDKKLDVNSFIKIRKKVMSFPFLPHHSFHVFNIFRRTGNDPNFHTLKTMDECRIGWGEIKSYSLSSRSLEMAERSHAILQKDKEISPTDSRRNDNKRSAHSISANYFVETKPIIIENGTLKFGKPIIKKITIDYKGKAFLKNLKIGDTISFHWSFACEVLNERQIKNLEYYTQKSIDYFNTKLF